MDEVRGAIEKQGATSAPRLEAASVAQLAQRHAAAGGGGERGHRQRP